MGARFAEWQVGRSSAAPGACAHAHLVTGDGPRISIPRARPDSVPLTHQLNLIDVRVLDHLIVGDDRCMSFAERGLI